jgi:opine dehydrogenase
VAVLGGGHGGLATAGHLTLKGFPVTLFSFFESELEAVREQNGVKLIGDVQGFASIDRVTTSVDAAVGDADIILVVYPGLVHTPIASILAGSLRDGQVILLTPGRTGGALEFARTLKRFAVRSRLYLAEAQTFMYAAEKRGPATVHVAREKRTMRVAALPASDNEVVVAKLRRLYPQIEPARNVLETSLNNIGAVVHPAPMLLNLPAIERAASGEHVRHYRDLITRSMCEMVLEPLDAEKVSVAKAMGLDAWTAQDWYRESYGVVGSSLFEVLQKNPYYAEFAAPTHLLGYHHILDEIPNSLVPIACFGEFVGVPTPTIRAIVDLASAVLGFDFWREGRTLESLGIDGLTLEEMIRYVEEGTLLGKCATSGLCRTRDGRVFTQLAHIEERAGGVG